MTRDDPLLPFGPALFYRQLPKVQRSLITEWRLGRFDLSAASEMKKRPRHQRLKIATN
jgi:hypothetical protein